jgi:hypothetical protein
MHTRMQDLARTTSCYRDEAANDNRPVSALWWLVPCFAVWVALIAWWLA